MLGENLKQQKINWESGCGIEKVDVELRKWMWNCKEENSIKWSRVKWYEIYNNYELNAKW